MLPHPCRLASICRDSSVLAGRSGCVHSGPERHPQKRVLRRQPHRGQLPVLLRWYSEGQRSLWSPNGLLWYLPRDSSGLLRYLPLVSFGSLAAAWRQRGGRVMPMRAQLHCHVPSAVMFQSTKPCFSSGCHVHRAGHARRVRWFHCLRWLLYGHQQLTPCRQQLVSAGWLR